jgi:hypothetical protein
MTQNQVIGEVRRTGTETVKVSIGEWKGKTKVDVRVHYLAEDLSWQPTKKGVTFTPEGLDKAIELLIEARERILNAARRAA